MKKKIALILACALSLSFFAGCSKDTTKITLYFKNAQTNELCEEKRDVDAGIDPTPTELAKIAITKLIEGPQNEKNTAVISPKATLLSITISENVATVNMSKHFLNKSGVDALLLRFALVNTLCSIDGIDGIVIQVEGKPLVSESTGQEYGVLRASDIALNAEDNITVKLYFPDENGGKLALEKREVNMQQALTVEKAVVSELLKGPEGKKLRSSIPAGTKLLGIETKDGVCYVNFSNEFCTKTSSGSTATTLTLYSVVNSLCTVKNVSSVQILINGETGVEFGNFVLDIPYEFNENLIG